MGYLNAVRLVQRHARFCAGLVYITALETIYPSCKFPLSVVQAIRHFHFCAWVALSLPGFHIDTSDSLDQ